MQSPYIKQDGLINLAEGLPEARIANSKVDVVMKQRGLALNKDKSVCVIIGNKKQKSKASEEIEKDPLLCGDFVTKEKEEEKWLGQIISAGGMADSVEKTVTALIGKIKAACLEIVQLVNDWSADVVGGMETAINSIMGILLYLVFVARSGDLDRYVWNNGAKVKFSATLVCQTGVASGTWSSISFPSVGFRLSGYGTTNMGRKSDAYVAHKQTWRWNTRGKSL